MRYDLFVSYAREDKEVVQALSEILISRGLRVWLDKFELKLGDDLLEKIDEGLRESTYGLVLLSPDFFKKKWTVRELTALVSKENSREKAILPIRHNISCEEVAVHSPILSGRVSASIKDDGLDQIAEKILKVAGSSTSTVIGISGASCSGKSWLAGKLRQRRPNDVTVFDLDSFYLVGSEVSDREYHYDNPKSMNFDEAIAALAVLKSGTEVRIPNYDFETGTVVGEHTCPPRPIIIVEGLFVFANTWLLKQLDLKVWISCDENIRFDRRIRRDTTERRKALQQVLDQYAEDVRPGYEKYIQPLRKEADVVLENNGRQVDAVPALVDLLLIYSLRRS